MKILFIANAACIHPVRFAQYFADRKYDVHFITYVPPEELLSNVKIHILPSFFSNIFLDFFPRQFIIHSIIKIVDPDVIHAVYISKFGWHIIPIRKKPIFLTALGSDILLTPYKNPIYYIFTKLALQKADIIYAVSKHIQQKIISEYQIPEYVVKYLPIGIDTSIFYNEKLELPLSTPIIRLFSNRGFRAEYDPITIIDAVGIVFKEYPHITLTLKGHASERKQCEDYVFQNGYDSFIQFLERTDYACVINDYKSADIFISAAISDGTPVSMIEAMACGLVCVMSDVGGVSEWIIDEYNGLLFPPKRPDILAQKIKFLIDNPEKRQIMRENAQKTILCRGNWTNLMKQIENDYHNIQRVTEIAQ
ncbi:MAG: glycosyltransferase family 4 protein [Methanospirillaceae archaeon]|nr:glycosyltransferase family 4 protein [Methanospirillaceae archaeon]